MNRLFLIFCIAHFSLNIFGQDTVVVLNISNSYLIHLKNKVLYEDYNVLPPLTHEDKLLAFVSKHGLNNCFTFIEANVFKPKKEFIDASYFMDFAYSYEPSLDCSDPLNVPICLRAYTTIANDYRGSSLRATKVFREYRKLSKVNKEITTYLFNERDCFNSIMSHTWFDYFLLHKRVEYELKKESNESILSEFLKIISVELNPKQAESPVIIFYDFNVESGEIKQS